MRVFSTLALAGLPVPGPRIAGRSPTSESPCATGRVSLSAKDATVRQILTEWARVGHTQIVNVERIAGGPITIEFTNVPEAEALDMLLRSVSGYMVAPRAVAIADASQLRSHHRDADVSRRGPRSGVGVSAAAACAVRAD